jgi:alkyldihydroxyacetonephosphate synthase
MAPVEEGSGPRLPLSAPEAPGRSGPRPPIAFSTDPADVTARLHAGFVDVDDATVDRLRDVCAEVTSDAATLSETSRDWWPLAMIWALDGQVAGRAAVITRPASAAQVADVLRVCHEARVPVTPAAGRSGVCGGSVPVHGGVVLDLCGLHGLVDVDSASNVVDVRAGTFGTPLEHTLRHDHDRTIGHWPQSIDLSTVGGWLACRGAGQLSTRYGKIEDMVAGLDVVLADGTSIRTGGAPRAAVGPDLDQLFVGCEGTLGIITGARLRVHPAPRETVRAAYGFTSFAAGLDTCRRILQRGTTPAVVRLYDTVEAERNFGRPDHHLLLVLDEGDPVLVRATMQVVAEECAGAEALDDALVDRWLEHRNDVSALEHLISQGFVVDTMEIAGRWRDLPAIYTAATTAIHGVDGTVAVSAHQSHAYGDGACLYFTFGGAPDADRRSDYYRAAWDAGTRAVLDSGGALSHHHGVGLNRARFVREALGDAFGVLAAAKQALDPRGILNPGKLGLASPFGPSPAWP